MNKQSIAIEGREIGPGHPAFIIAEIGVNHNGSPDTAMAMIDAFAETGVQRRYDCDHRGGAAASVLLREHPHQVFRVATED